MPLLVKKRKNPKWEPKQFMNYHKYKELAEKKFASLLSGDELYVIIDDKDIIDKIKIPQFYIELARESGEPLSNLINYAIRYLIIELKYGNLHKSRSILRIIKDFESIDESSRKKLLAYILKCMGELTHE